MSINKQKRIDLIQDIIHKDPTRYGYLNHPPFNTCISANDISYPDAFLQALYECMKLMEEYHTEIRKDDPVWGVKYGEFIQEYANCYNIAVQLTQQQQQEYIAAMYAQQQQQQAYQQQYGQQYGQQTQQPYGQQQVQQQVGQQQQGGYQRNYQHRNQNYNQQGQQQTP
jgi:hypothetical protein